MQKRTNMFTANNYVVGNHSTAMLDSKMCNPPKDRGVGRLFDLGGVGGAQFKINTGHREWGWHRLKTWGGTCPRCLPPPFLRL